MHTCQKAISPPWSQNAKCPATNKPTSKAAKFHPFLEHSPRIEKKNRKQLLQIQTEWIRTITITKPQEA